MASTDDRDSVIRIVLIVLAALLLLPLVMMVLAFPLMGMMGGVMVGGPGFASPLWALAMLLVWLVVLGGIGYVIYRAAVGSGSGSRDHALEELRLAYARGDLTDEEYKARREALEREERPAGGSETRE